jgi:hypothetical protein
LRVSFCSTLGSLPVSLHLKSRKEAVVFFTTFSDFFFGH